MNFRLVQVIPHDDMGGMQRVASELEKALPSRGISTTLLSLRDWVGRPTDSEDLHRTMWRDSSRLFSTWMRLIISWRTSRPNAVLAHTSFSAAYASSAARIARVPQRISVVHGNRETVGRLRSVVLSVLTSLGFLTDVVFVGYAAAESFGRTLGRSRCVVIQNGVVTPDRQECTTVDFDSSVAHLISAGRLVDGKNLQMAINAAAACAGPVLLHIFGDGDLRSDLEDQATSLNAPVVFHGEVSQTELWQWYRIGTAFIFPTFGEGLPLVLIEAAANHLPAIASDRRFNREVMGDAALYCPPEEKDAWARAIDLLCRDAHLRSELRERAVARSKHFSLERMVDEYADLLTGAGS